MKKSMIYKLNEMAQVNFEKAQVMLEGINLALGTAYGWLGKRVVWFEKPDASTAEKYAFAHDAYACADKY